jgi:hypothetical protein
VEDRTMKKALLIGSLLWIALSIKVWGPYLFG